MSNFLFVGHFIFISKRFGNTDQKKEWLTQLISMNKLASYCLTEPNSGSDSASMVTKKLKKCKSH